MRLKLNPHARSGSEISNEIFRVIPDSALVDHINSPNPFT